jgi:hypothetical protein
MPRVAAALAAALVVLLPARPSAHEIPADVRIQAFLAPEGQRLRLLVRAPLAAMRDVNFPTHGPGYLDLTRAEPQLRHAASLWIADAVRLYEGERRLPGARIAAIRISLPSDLSFSGYGAALAHVLTPPPADVELMWNQALLDVLLEYPIQSDRSRFAIEPAFARLGGRVVTSLRFIAPGGAVRPFEFTGDPGVTRLDPRWHQAALRFVKAGFLHILDGVDHLLFLLCLVIPLRRVRPLVLVVTAFTVAHSITLVGSAFGLAPDALWFPPLVEMLIAISIVYMAFENIVGAKVERRWLMAFGFGLVHGFGFSFALRETMQFAGSHMLTALLSFNVGVELGQLLVLALLVPALHVMFRYMVAERMGAIILSALVAHTGWHWMLDRGDRLRQFDFVWPAPDAALLAAALRWLMVAVILAALIWLVRTQAPAARASARRAVRAAGPDPRARASGGGAPRA